MEQPLLKLHLGCGSRYIPGFVNIDRRPLPNADRVHDARTLEFVPNNSVSLIYAGQILEYFDREEVQSVLAEWSRTLVSGGILRLCVPNFEVYTRLYLTGLSLDWFVGSMYGRIASGPGPYDYHRTTYDEPSLRGVLTRAGFVDIAHWDWRTTEHADIDDFSQAYFPHMEKERGIQWNLNLEGRKP
ncbi:class I SAM-dependent methyltransferase [Rhizobium sp. C1]|uniref:class I SAM-dependent methyltransferase n=1 Tax=Rhizobium sp. C1 TaxID=1349799 RepID=UPI000BC401D4|nr:methyltransferase domain-containing protein [Rhizobium sp. C1]MCD2177304.1 methyltransferase domain-containing protein [Rhizobium sp. C1]SOC83159.1 Predicted SAM-depedendent methyltransferase [Ensifer adhaerens]